MGRVCARSMSCRILLVGIGLATGAHAIHDKEVELAGSAMDSRTLESTLTKLATKKADFYEVWVASTPLI